MSKIIEVFCNQQVDEWKGVLADKDSKIADHQQHIMELRERIAAHDMDSEKTSVIALSKVGGLHYSCLEMY